MGWVRRLFSRSEPEPVVKDGIPDDWAVEHRLGATHQFNEQFYKQARDRQLEHERTEHFTARMVAAMERYWQFRRAADEDGSVGDDQELNEDDLRVVRLPSRLSPSNFYGVHFKDTGEYGVCESYRFDDGRFQHSFTPVPDESFEAGSYTPL